MSGVRALSVFGSKLCGVRATSLKDFAVFTRTEDLQTRKVSRSIQGHKLLTNSHQTPNKLPTNSQQTPNKLQTNSTHAPNHIPGSHHIMV